MSNFGDIKTTLKYAVAAAIIAAPGVAMAAKGGGGGGEAEAGLGFWGTLAFQAINFVVFFGIIVYYAAPALREHYSDKRAALRADLEEAERLREEAEAKLEEYTAKLEALEAEREQMLEEYHEQGEREKQRLIDEAKQQITKMREDAEKTIDQEVRKAVAGIEEQAVEMAVEMAREMASSELDTSKQHALIDAYVADLNEHSKRATG